MSTQAAKITALESEMTAVKAKLTALEAKMEAFTATTAKPAKGTKKPKDPDAPKKEPNWWLKATEHVRSILKPRITEMNSSLAEGEKKIPGTAPVAVTKLLKDQGAISSEGWDVAEEAVMAAFTTFRENLSEAGSTTSKASKTSKPKLAELSEEEQKARRSEIAKKAAATRAANKAKKEEAAATPAPADDSQELSAVPWKANIGKGLKDYERIEYNGLTYVYTTDSVYLGVWNEKTKKLDATVPDIGA